MIARVKLQHNACPYMSLTCWTLGTRQGSVCSSWCCDACLGVVVHRMTAGERQPPCGEPVAESLTARCSFAALQEKGQLLENVFADPKGFGLDPSGAQLPCNKAPASRQHQGMMINSCHGPDVQLTMKCPSVYLSIASQASTGTRCPASAAEMPLCPRVRVGDTSLLQTVAELLSSKADRLQRALAVQRVLVQHGRCSPGATAQLYVQLPLAVAGRRRSCGAAACSVAASLRCHAAAPAPPRQPHLTWQPSLVPAEGCRPQT